MGEPQTVPGATRALIECEWKHVGELLVGRPVGS